MSASRPIAAFVAVAALALSPPAAALTPQPFVDVTPAGSKLILCPADIGGGAGLAWQRFEETAGSYVVDLSAAGLDAPAPSLGLLRAGGCPSTATAGSGASLIAFTRTGFSTQNPGRLFVVDRARDATASAPIALTSSDRAEAATAALAAAGAGLVAWKEVTESKVGRETTIPYAAARDAGGAFGPPRPLGPAGGHVKAISAGVDDAGYAIVVWSLGERAERVVFAIRAPGGAFTAPRELGRAVDLESLSLVVGAAGEALVALSDSSGVRIASGTARAGPGALRRLASGETADVTVALSASGAGAVAWLQPRGGPARAEVVVSDRPAGGDFGVPHALIERTSRAGAVGFLRLAAAPDGRMLASWAVTATPGERSVVPVLVAALRRVDGGWEPSAALLGPCRVPIDAFPGFDAAGGPRVTLVDGGVVSRGDFGFPSDSRVRVVRLAGAAATLLEPPPRATLSAARSQVLRAGAIRLRVRCAGPCDAHVFSVIRGESDERSGLFPVYRRLRAGRARTVVLRRQSYFDATGNVLRDEGRIVEVKLVVHACDSAGRLARAGRTIRVRVPRARPRP